jgi:radical SAM superfamily enzyme
MTRFHFSLHMKVSSTFKFKFKKYIIYFFALNVTFYNIEVSPNFYLLKA